MCLFMPYGFKSCSFQDAGPESHPFLRRRARDRVVLVEDHKKKKKVLPTLMNMALNAVILRPFTKAMAEHGLIRNPISLIKEAL